MISPLERLPAELQVAICHELVEDDATRSDEALKSQQRTFYALCLTSKTLHAAATPFLYATIDTSEADDLLAIRLLTRTLCAEPELAKHVQSLSVAQLSTKLIAPPSEQHIEVCKAALDRIRCKDTKEALKFAIERGCSTAEVVALFYVCRNVRDLSIDLSEITYHGRAQTELESPCTECPDMPRCFNAIYAGSWKGNSKLENVDVIAFEKDLSKRSIQEIGIIHYLGMPTLRELSCSGVKSSITTLAPAWSPSSNIKSLTMVYVDLNAADVATLLGTMHDLKELRLQWTNPDEEDWNLGTDDQSKINIQDFFPELNRHRKTLESLTLHDLQGNEIRLCSSPTVSFHDFEKLSVLEISEHVILSHSGEALADLSSRLPPNLNDLLLRCGECLTERLEGILKVLATCQAKELGYFEVTFPDEVMDDDDRAKMMELTVHDGVYPSVGIRAFENIGRWLPFWRGYGQYAYEAAEHYLDLINKHGIQNLLDGKIELARYGFEDRSNDPPAQSPGEAAAGQTSE